MSVPQLTVYRNGPNAVSGDQLNTFVQGAQTANQLRTLTGVTGMSIMLQGITTPGDGGAGFFYWNSAATASDDNLNTIVPYGTQAGAWLRDDIGGGGGPATQPGGTSGQVQYNNNGAFGGLSNAALTALIAPFTATASGAAPPSGGGTTTFLRADGAWAAPAGGGGGNVTGPTTSVSGDLASFSGSGGTTIQDAGISAAKLAVSMASGQLAFNVKNFGAVGDGATDDTAAIQAAASAIPATGGILYFPASTGYAVSNGVKLQAHTTVLGDGRGSLMKALSTMSTGGPSNPFSNDCFFCNVNGSYNGTTVTDADILVRDMAFDATAAPDIGELHCVRFGQVLRTHVEDCYFNNIGDGVAHIGCDTTLVRGCSAYGVINAAWDHWGGTVNSEVDACTAKAVSSATLSYGTAFNAANTSDTTSINSAFFKVTNCIFYGFGQCAILASPLGSVAHADNIYSVTITGNQINGTGAAAGASGIILQGQGSQHLVANNQLFNISGGVPIGILPQGAFSPTDCIVSGNLIYACNPSGSNTAHIQSNGDRTLIVGNHITGGTAVSNIYITGTDCFVANNSCIGWTAEQINVAGSTNPVVIQTDMTTGNSSINQLFGALSFQTAALLGNPALSIRNAANQVIANFPAVTSPVNYPQLTAAATGGAVTISAVGTDTNVNLNLVGQGTGAVSIKGTSTNNSAAAGQVGEYISASIAVGSAIAIVGSGVAQNITSISLTAGDWDVSGMVGFLPAASTTFNAIIAGIGTTSATFNPPMGGAYASLAETFTTGAAQALSLCPARISLASTTTVYLVAQANFSVSTMNAYGFIGARRAR